MFDALTLLVDFFYANNKGLSMDTMLSDKQFQVSYCFFMKKNASLLIGICLLINLDNGTFIANMFMSNNLSPALFSPKNQIIVPQPGCL